MSFRGELEVLAARKHAVQARIEAHRAECVSAARAMVHPFSTPEGESAGLLGGLPALAKSVGIPAGILLGRRLVSRFADPAQVGPLLVRAVRWFGPRGKGR